MARSVVLLILGAIAGGAGVYLLKGQGNAPEPAVVPARSVSPNSADPVAAPAAATGTGSFAAARLAVYEQAAGAADAFDLESMIRSAALEPQSRSRDMKLQALLARLAELDPRHALDIARAQYLEIEFFAPIYRIWAATDPDAAVAELAGIRPPAEQRALALEVLATLGDTQANIDRISAVLAPIDRTGFAIDALVLKAEYDPATALRQWNDLGSSTIRSLALVRIAEAAALLDPGGAMRLTGAIDDMNLRDTYRNGVLNAWADSDPDAVFEWLESANFADLPEYTAAYQTLAASDAERLLRLIDRMPAGALINVARSAAIQGIASQDPERAVALLDTLPPGQDRDQMIQAIAQAWGRQDPDLALAWVRQLSPPSSNALGAALRGIAEVDPERAIDLMIADIERAGSNNINAASSYMSLILSFGMNLEATGGVDVGRMFDRLVDIENPLLESMLGSAVGNWARRDADAALNWAMANAGRLDQNSFRNIAQSFAADDPDRAIAMLDGLPPELQAGWVQGVTGQLAQTDRNRALSLVERLRGSPAYPTAYASLVRDISRNDPAEAARMLASGPPIPPNEIINTAMNVSMQWARQDPAAAAQWAIGLDDERARTQSLNVTVQQWAQSDSQAARQWLLGMSRGAERDAALSAYVSAAAQTGRFEADLLDSFSNDRQAQQSAVSAITQIGRSDMDEARRLLDRYVTDPALRRTAEESLQRTGGIGGGSPILLPSGVIF